MGRPPRPLAESRLPSTTPVDAGALLDRRVHAVLRAADVHDLVDAGALRRSSGARRRVRAVAAAVSRGEPSRAPHLVNVCVPLAREANAQRSGGMVWRGFVRPSP